MNNKGDLVPCDALVWFVGQGVEVEHTTTDPELWRLAADAVEAAEREGYTLREPLEWLIKGREAAARLYRKSRS